MITTKKADLSFVKEIILNLNKKNGKELTELYDDFHTILNISMLSENTKENNYLNPTIKLLINANDITFFDEKLFSYTMEDVNLWIVKQVKKDMYAQINLDKNFILKCYKEKDLLKFRELLIEEIQNHQKTYYSNELQNKSEQSLPITNCDQDTKLQFIISHSSYLLNLFTTKNFNSKNVDFFIEFVHEQLLNISDQVLFKTIASNNSNFKKILPPSSYSFKNKKEFNNVKRLKKINNIYFHNLTRKIVFPCYKNIMMNRIKNEVLQELMSYSKLN